MHLKSEVPRPIVVATVTLGMTVAIALVAFVAVGIVCDADPYRTDWTDEDKWKYDYEDLQTAVDEFYQDHRYYPTNSGEGLDNPLMNDYPIPESDGIGDACIVFNQGIRDNEHAGLVDLGYVSSTPWSSRAFGYGVAKNPGGADGHYVWYVDSTGEVHSWYDVDSDGIVDADEIDFVEGVYP